MKREFEFRIMRFGKPLAETVCVEAENMQEAMKEAKKFLGIGEYLGKLE